MELFELFASGFASGVVFMMGCYWLANISTRRKLNRMRKFRGEHPEKWQWEPKGEK